MRFSIPLALAGQVPPATAPSAAASSKVWVGRYAEYETYLRGAAIDRTRGTPQRVFFEPGGLAAGGALHREGYKFEIAGYRVDRLLNLDMVPPTVEVRVDGDVTSLKLWVLNTRPLKRISDGGVGAPDPAKWTFQLHHSLALPTTRALPYEIGTTLSQIDRPFFNRIKALSKTTVKRAIGDLVDTRAIDALFARRDDIVKAFEKLAAQKGATQVFQL